MASVFLLLLPCALSSEDIGWQETNFDNSNNEEISWQNDNFDAAEMKPRHLKGVPPSPDLSKYRGLRVTIDQSIVTLGKQQEIKLFRFVFFLSLAESKRKRQQT